MRIRTLKSRFNDMAMPSALRLCATVMPACFGALAGAMLR